VPHNSQANPQILSGCTHVVALTAAQDGGAGRTGVGYGTLTLTGSTLTLNNITYSGLSGNSVRHTFTVPPIRAWTPGYSTASGD
jgi:hypothetical protein